MWTWKTLLQSDFCLKPFHFLSLWLQLNMLIWLKSTLIDWLTTCPGFAEHFPLMSLISFSKGLNIKKKKRRVIFVKMLVLKWPLGAIYSTGFSTWKQKLPEASVTNAFSWQWIRVWIYEYINESILIQAYAFHLWIHQKNLTSWQKRDKRKAKQHWKSEAEQPQFSTLIQYVQLGCFSFLCAH